MSLCTKCNHKLDIFGDCDFCIEAEKALKDADKKRKAIIAAYKAANANDEGNDLYLIAQRFKVSIDIIEDILAVQRKKGKL